MKNTIAKRSAKDLNRLTRKRLYAYPQLKENIEQYKLNIEDIKQQKDFGKSKSIVLFCSRSATEPPTIEEIRDYYIKVEEAKMEQDEAEVKAMDRALATIRDDAYYTVIKMSFFQKINEDEVAEKLHISKTTVYRTKGRLIDRLNIALYGAEAIEI